MIDARSGANIATLKIGKGPDGVLLDAARRRAFIPAADGTLSVLALRARDDIALVGAVKTTAGAKTGAVDPSTGNIYLPSVELQPPEKEGARPKPVPGSFTILVVAPKN